MRDTEEWYATEGESLPPAADSVMTPHLRKTFAFYSTAITIGLMTAVMSALVLVTLAAAQQVWIQDQMR